jgi:hypothetical protein
MSELAVRAGQREVLDVSQGLARLSGRASHSL